MNKKFLSFYDRYNSDFSEHLDSARMYVQNTNQEYKKMYNEINNILENNKNLQKLIYDEKIESVFSYEECNLLSRIISLYLKTQDIIEKEIYFKGGYDAYDYFKKIGII